MSLKLFVGGLAWGTTDATLKDFFAQVGQVVSATVITDKFSGKSKGFGFVEMSSEAEATEAVSKLNGQELDGRKIIVNEARPKPEGGSGGSRPFTRDFSAHGGDRRGGSDFRRGGSNRGSSGYR